MDMNSLKFVIVGHVDHGKSTLIGRLLYDTDSLPPDRIAEIKKASQGLGRDTEFAYLLDHLEEERQQGITIDTTQVFFKTSKKGYIIIDAPGHVEFVKNMITGASQAEAAVLIIDIKDGVKEQTKRHAYILSLLGLDQVIVVLNKMDLADFSEARFDEAKDRAEAFLSSINIKPLFYIPICATAGFNITGKSENMTWYDGPSFLESLDNLKSRGSSDEKPLIFPIQDVYKIDDKRIIVGKVEAGTINKDSDIHLLPSGQDSKVKSIEKFLEKRVTASAGESIGIMTEDPVFIDRGNIICSKDDQVPVLTDRFNANIFWMAKNDFKKSERITIRCATQETTCKIEDIKRRIDSSTLEIIQQDADVLKNLEVGEVTIKTKEPIAIKSFNDVNELGRFVFVKDENICAGGIITEII